MTPPSAPTEPRTAVYLGRFQPVHQGHVAAIDQILGEVDRVLVLIGSAQESHTLADPLSAGERYQLLEAALPDDPRRIRLIPMMDLGRNLLWWHHLRALLPPFEAVYTNNPLVRLLAEDAGVHARPIPLQNRSDWSATRIRELILQGDDAWRKAVPEGTLPLLDRFDLVGRLHALERGDA